MEFHHTVEKGEEIRRQSQNENLKWKRSSVGRSLSTNCAKCLPL